MSDDEWETDPDFVNNQSEEEQRWGKSRNGVQKVDMNSLKEDVINSEKEKCLLPYSYSGADFNADMEANTDSRTLAAKPGKKVWQPSVFRFSLFNLTYLSRSKNSFDDKMASQLDKTNKSLGEEKPTKPSPAPLQDPHHEETKSSPKEIANTESSPPPEPPIKPILPSKVQGKASEPRPEPSSPPAVIPKPPSKSPPPKPPGPPPPQAPAIPGKPNPQDEASAGEGNRFSADLRAKGLEVRTGEEAPHGGNERFMTQPGIVFEKAINLKIKSVHHKVENQNLAINSARAIGCNVINIGAQDLIDGRPHLVLGLLWQIIKILLLKRVSLKEHPELVLLLKPGEDLATLLKLPKEELLVRWVNFHLVNAGCEKRLSNFSGDVKDSAIYIYLMSRICPEHCDLSPLQEKDERKRAQKVLDNAAKIGCKTTFVKANDIIAGNKDLNFAFTALLFNEHPALYVDDTSNQVEVATLLEEDNAEASREERVFQNWMNSLGIESQVHKLLEDCKTGEPLLQVMEKLNPSVVNWKMVNKNPRVQIKTIENCNYMVECAKALGLHTVNIGGKDIHDGNAKLVLGLAWQLMRHDTMSLLGRLGGDAKLSDSDLVQWGNERVQAHFNSSSRKISSLSDPSIATSLFLLQLCESVTPGPGSPHCPCSAHKHAGLVDWDIVTEGATEEDREHNAKVSGRRRQAWPADVLVLQYVLSVARKMGCGIFLLYVDG
eukprot:755726-Hanusia_phi.AAC.1